MAGRTWLLEEPGIGEAGQLHRDRQYPECGYSCFASTELFRFGEQPFAGQNIPDAIQRY